MMKKYKYIIIILLLPIIGQSQYDFQKVLDGYEGEQLFQKLIEDYKPLTVLDYSDARDKMYGEIYNENDTVRGIYTNYSLYLPPGVDPSTYLYKGGSNSGINAEHVYPRSKGAKEGNPKSDMHHLFPSKINVNSDRGSLPFNEIKDNQTNDWYYKNIIRHSIPQNRIDDYSEHISTYFEPREVQKGNIARAMMYFYTMYKQEADLADPNFFRKQIDTLCKWHFMDPVDSLEWVRTFEIAKYQSGKPNPFVLDCSLATRTYCDFISGECTAVATSDLIEESMNIVLYPNPSSEYLNLKFVNPGMSYLDIEVFNVLGKNLYSKKYKLFGVELERFKISIKSFEKGVYFVRAKGQIGNKVYSFNKKFVKY